MIQTVMAKADEVAAQQAQQALQAQQQAQTGPGAAPQN